MQMTVTLWGKVLYIFSVKSKRVNISESEVIWSLLQLLNSAVTVQKQPKTMGKCVSVTVFPSDFIYKTVGGL